MDKLHLPHNVFVFVGDGRKALFLRNEGDEKFPNLKTERVFVEENPPTHEQGTDRPGRGFMRAGTNRRSGLDNTDWHQLEEHRFAQRVAAAMEQLVRDRKVKVLVVAAAHARRSTPRFPCRREGPDCRRDRQGSEQAPDCGYRKASAWMNARTQNLPDRYSNR